MLKVIGLISLICTLILSAFFHNEIIMLGVGLKLSFLFSSITVYVIYVVLISLIYFVLDQILLAYSKGLMRRLISVSILIASVFIIFKLHPIYIDDYMNVYEEIILDDKHKSAIDEGLNIVVIQGCPFCSFRVEEIKNMKNIHQDIPMNILVIHQDTIAYDAYREIAGENVNVDYISSELMAQMEVNRFPYLFYKSNRENTALMRWSNRNFNGASWDYIVKEF